MLMTLEVNHPLNPVLEQSGWTQSKEASLASWLYQVLEYCSSEQWGHLAVIH
jgi:hypothetical protein